MQDVRTAFLFPDTNFFLQFRDSRELPWPELVSNPNIRLLVCRTVQRQVDVAKNDGNPRRQKRARLVASLFREIIRSGEPNILREYRPRIELDLAPRVPPNFTHPSTLDLRDDDDRIVAEILAYSKLHSVQVALITDDTGQMLTARNHDLKFLLLPDDWRLQPEPTERDRKIQDLERQIKTLTTSLPDLTIEASIGYTHCSHGITVIHTKYEPLPETSVEQFVDEVSVLSPMITDFSRTSGAYSTTTSLDDAIFQLDRAMSGLPPGEWRPPTAEAIAQYQNELYPKWLHAVRDIFSGLHDEATVQTTTPPLSFTLANVGTVPAESVVVEIEALGGLRLSEPNRKPATLKAQRVTLPNPPTAPSWSFVPVGDGGHMSLAEFAARTREKATLASRQPLGTLSFPAVDPRKFYPVGRSLKAVEPRLSFTCADFWHEADPQRFDVCIALPREPQVCRGSVRFRVAARNLPMRKEVVISIHVQHQPGDTRALARKLIEDFRLKCTSPSQTGLSSGRQ